MNGEDQILPQENWFEIRQNSNNSFLPASNTRYKYLRRQFRKNYYSKDNVLTLKQKIRTSDLCHTVNLCHSHLQEADKFKISQINGNHSYHAKQTTLPKTINDYNYYDLNMETRHESYIEKFRKRRKKIIIEKKDTIFNKLKVSKPIKSLKLQDIIKDKGKAKTILSMTDISLNKPKENKFLEKEPNQEIHNFVNIIQDKQ